MSTHFYIYGETLSSCLQLKSCLLCFLQTDHSNQQTQPKWEERLWLDLILHPLCSVFLSHCVRLTNAPLYKDFIGSEQTARTINNENRYKCMLRREWAKRWAENNTHMDIKTGNILSFFFKLLDYLLKYSSVSNFISTLYLQCFHVMEHLTNGVFCCYNIFWFQDCPDLSLKQRKHAKVFYQKGIT